MNNEATVFIVAGDPGARRAWTARLKALQVPAKICHSAEEFFAAYAPGMLGCVILAVTRPATDLELLRSLGPPDRHLPVIAVTGNGDVPAAVAVMKLGARDVLTEASSEEQLAAAIDDALAWDLENRRRVARAENVRRRIARLAPGERQVLDLLVAGHTNREIAEELELSVRAIEVRRAKVMAAMRARSLAELVRLSITAR